MLIDTDIIVDVLRNEPKAKLFIDEQISPTISVITEMELLVGCRNKTEQNKLDKFLARFTIIELDERICKSGISLLRNYSLSHGLRIPDALIAATSLELGSEIATRNIRDYRFIKGLKLFDYQ